MERQCQMILLCGYLGSGKTTLIRYVLEKQREYKVAVIQNEFSDDMGIESPLMRDSEDKPFDKLYEMPNGCLCCSAKTDMIKAVEFLIEQEHYQLDYILIETNGLADPSNTIQEFWVDRETKFPYGLKSVQTLLAAHTIQDMLNREATKEVFIRQLVYADQIYLNHIDKIKEEEITTIHQQIRRFNPLATIHNVEYAQLPSMAMIFEQQGFQQTKYDFQVNKVNVHVSDSIKHVYLTFGKESEFNYDGLNQLVAELLWEEKENVKIMRMKGIFKTTCSTNIYSLQAVEDTFELVDGGVEWNNTLQSKVLVVYELADQAYQFEQQLRERMQRAIVI